MRCPGKEAIEAHFMSAIKEVTTVLTLSNSQSVAFYNNFKILHCTHTVYLTMVLSLVYKEYLYSTLYIGWLGDPTCCYSTAYTCIRVL